MAVAVTLGVQEVELRSQVVNRVLTFRWNAPTGYRHVDFERLAHVANVGAQFQMHTRRINLFSAQLLP